MQLQRFAPAKIDSVVMMGFNWEKKSNNRRCITTNFNQTGLSIDGHQSRFVIHQSRRGTRSQPVTERTQQANKAAVANGTRIAHSHFPRAAPAQQSPRGSPKTPGGISNPLPHRPQATPAGSSSSSSAPLPDPAPGPPRSARAHGVAQANAPQGHHPRRQRVRHAIHYTLPFNPVLFFFSPAPFF